jgi:hypothetical protein
MWDKDLLFYTTELGPAANAARRKTAARVGFMSDAVAL